MMIIKSSLLVLAMLFAVSLSPAYAQHHSGALAPPIDFDGMKVALMSILSPDDFSIEESKSANLSIRFFDSESNTNIKSVTYRIQIFNENNLVANEYFFDEDGKLDLEIRPTTGCKDQNLWKCTKYFGEKHPIAGAYYARGDSRPIIQGPVFDQSGQYNVKVSIVGATNPKTMTTSDLEFETFLTIPKKQIFVIQTANAQEFPISIKSFEGDITNFSYDESTKKISYEIPFDWSSKSHQTNVKQYIYLQKDFSAFKQENDIDVYIEGKKLETKIHNFDITSPERNTIKLDITHDDIMKIHNNLGKSHADKKSMKIDILPGKTIQMNQMNFEFNNGFSAKTTWNSELKAGQKIPFTITFYDANMLPANKILYAYSLSDSSGKELLSNIGNSDTYLGILSQNGVSQESIFIPSNGKYELKLILTGQDTKNFKEFFVAKSSFEISSQVSNQETSIVIPPWIKNNAGWWADGIIGDGEFVQSIQFLIKEKILVIPATSDKITKSQEVPGWIKNNAGWWADGLISERDFVKGIEFLITEGIVKVN